MSRSRNGGVSHKVCDKSIDFTSNAHPGCLSPPSLPSSALGARTKVSRNATSRTFPPSIPNGVSA